MDFQRATWALFGLPWIPGASHAPFDFHDRQNQPRASSSPARHRFLTTKLHCNAQNFHISTSLSGPSPCIRMRGYLYTYEELPPLGGPSGGDAGPPGAVSKAAGPPPPLPPPPPPPPPQPAAAEAHAHMCSRTHLCRATLVCKRSRIASSSLSFNLMFESFHVIPANTNSSSGI